MMPVLVAAIIGALASALSSMVGRILVQLGIGFFVFKGVGAGMDLLSGMVRTNLTGLPVITIQILGMCKVDVALNMIASAITARMTIDGLSGGDILKTGRK
jgi:hypothetical protein